MSESAASPDGFNPDPFQIKQTILEGASVGGNLTTGSIDQSTHIHLPPPPKTEPKPFTVPYLRNQYFTGRVEILSQIHKTLGQSGTAALSQAEAIHGLGGVGKTQTAVEYAYRYAQDEAFYKDGKPVYDWVLWVNASNLTLASSFAAIATDLALENHATNKQDDNIAAVLRWLETTDCWLLIFDNVDEPNKIKPFRPKNPNGRILITSRVPRLESLGVADSIALDKMEPAEAHEFLQRRSKRSGSPLNPPQVRDFDQEQGSNLSELASYEGSEVPQFWGVGGQADSLAASEQQAIATLAKELGYLPLALEQAAAYILAKGVRFAAYWRSYQKKRLQVLEKEKPQVGDYPDSVATTWAINFEAVKQSSLAAADLLYLSAFLAPDNIPYELLILGKDHLGELLNEALADATEDELVLPELLEELTRYSLIRLETDYRYSIHRMVQEVLRDELEETQQQQWRNRAVEALNRVFPAPEFKNWIWCERLIEHVQAIDRQKATQTIELGRLLNQTGYFLDDQGRYAEAELLLVQALRITQAQLGKEHPNTARSLNNLAELYRLQSQYNKAEPLLVQALHIAQTQFGQEHLYVAVCLNNLALLYKAQGHYSKMEPLYQQALHIRQTQLGQEHPDTSSSLNNLAGLYFSQNRHCEAELLYRQALHIRQTQLGLDHPSTATSLNNLAGLYYAQGRYAEAEPLYLQTLAILMQKLGENHPNTQGILRNFVYFLQQVIAAGRAGELSDRPVTQGMLAALQAEEQE